MLNAKGSRRSALALGWMALAGLWTTASAIAPARADGEGVTLREEPSRQAATAARIDLRATGLFRPDLPPDEKTSEAKMPKPLDIDIQTRVIFRERRLDDAEGPPKAIRLVSQAASAINGEVRPTAHQLREELSILIVERADDGGHVVAVSPSGSLTRAELELVQGVGDPLCLPSLLPDGSVSQGDAWPVSRAGVMTITGYEGIESTKVEAKVESITDDRVVIALRGEAKGTVLKGTGTMTIDGRFEFDREAALIDQVELNRTETRQPGPIEAGLDLKSTLRIIRRPTAVPSELADEALKDLSLEITPARKLVQLIAPDGRYDLLHDRTWHTYWDDSKLIVLKRFEPDKDRVTAQCNFAYGPQAGKGKHQDVQQFRDDVRKAMGDRFSQFLGAGEVDPGDGGGFRYKLGVQGREGELGVLWFYYLIASPAGDQLLATFTLADSDAVHFAQEDENLIGTLRWNDPPLAVKP